MCSACYVRENSANNKLVFYLSLKPPHILIDANTESDFDHETNMYPYYYTNYYDIFELLK